MARKPKRHPVVCGGMVLAEKIPRGLILLIMVFDKIGEGGSGEKARLARLARMILVEYMEPKDFFCSSSGKFSSAAPIYVYTLEAALIKITLIRNTLVSPILFRDKVSIIFHVD